MRAQRHGALHNPWRTEVRRVLTGMPCVHLPRRLDFHSIAQRRQTMRTLLTINDRGQIQWTVAPTHLLAPGNYFWISLISQYLTRNATYRAYRLSKRSLGRETIWIAFLNFFPTHLPSIASAKRFAHRADPTPTSTADQLWAISTMRNSFYPSMDRPSRGATQM